MELFLFILFLSLLCSNLQKATDSMQFTEDYQTADLAILQSLALRSRILHRFLSGNSSYSAYTLG